MSRPECGSAADPLAYFVVRCREIYFGLAVAGAARSKVSANRLPHRSRPRIAGAFLLVLLVATLAYVSSWFAAGALTAPARTRLGAPPANLGAEPVNFASTSGSLLAGWFVPGSECRAVVLMHPKDGNRAAMLGRAKFLAQAGYSVLLFDFHAHGESTGESITFGWLESRDALTHLLHRDLETYGNSIGWKRRGRVMSRDFRADSGGRVGLSAVSVSAEARQRKLGTPCRRCPEYACEARTLYRPH
jgi:hypothetical protein